MSHRAKKLEVATILKEASKMCRPVMLACHKKHSSTWIPVSRTSHRHKRGKPPSFVATTIEKNIWLWISLRTWIKIYHIYCSIVVDFHEQKMFARLCYNHFEKSNIWKSSGLIKTSFNCRKNVSNELLHHQMFDVNSGSRWIIPSVSGCIRSAYSKTAREDTLESIASDGKRSRRCSSRWGISHTLWQSLP